MGGRQTADFQGDEVRHGEHVPGDHHHHHEHEHDDVCRTWKRYSKSGMIAAGLMARMVVTYFDNHSQFHVHAFVLRLFCAILTVIDQRGGGSANFRIFWPTMRRNFFFGALRCPLEYSI